MDRAVRQVPLPGVMKLEFGAGAVGVRLVKDTLTVPRALFRIAETCRARTATPGHWAGLGQCYAADGVHRGARNMMWICCCLAGGCWLPSSLTMAPRAVACFPLRPQPACPLGWPGAGGAAGAGRLPLLPGLRAAGRGLQRGLKLTGAGPRLIEINPRMGGFYLRDWILELYGVDLLLAAAMVACGLRPALPAHPRARGHLSGCHVPGVPALEGTEFHRQPEPCRLFTTRACCASICWRRPWCLVNTRPYCSVACAGSSSPARPVTACWASARVLGIDGAPLPRCLLLVHFK